MSIIVGARDPSAPSGHLPTRSVGREVSQSTNLLRSAFFASALTFSRT
jgi:hypothetical protein